MFMPIIDFLSSYFSPGILLGLSLFSVIGALKLFDLVIGLFQVTYTDDNKKKITTFVGLLPWKKRKDPLADCVCIAEAGKHFWRKLRDLVVKREFIFIEWVRNPIFAFLFGAFLTLLTMSALASEAILLPFYLSRVIQIRTVIFFILGAGTTRIIDTLIVALMSQSTSAIEIILIILGLSFVVSVLCIVLMKWFVPVAVNSVQFLSRNVWRFLVFLLFVIGVPLGILLL
ncbi:MAG: hypothetical protein U9Q15_02250 [Patescibacteria group bacterium]|nr:hypothetical protein [Patescibacteria group bacterium]